MAAKKFFSMLGQGHNVFERVLSSAGGLLILILTLLVPVDVFLRYVFNHPLAGLYELSELMLVGMVYLSITYVQANKGHVVIDIFLTKIPGRPRRAMNLATYFFCLLICFLMTWRTGYLAWQAWDTQDYTSGLVQWPLWPAKAVISVGCGLLGLRLIRDLWNELIPHKDSRS